MNLFGESQKIKQLDISYNTNKNKGIKLQYFLIGVIGSKQELSLNGYLDERR